MAQRESKLWLGCLSRAAASWRCSFPLKPLQLCGFGSLGRVPQFKVARAALRLRQPSKVSFGGFDKVRFGGAFERRCYPSSLGKLKGHGTEIPEGHVGWSKVV